jgi:ribosome maturation factor RimP
MRKEIAHLWNAVEPSVKAPGFELVELEWTRDVGGWVLRVFIDRPFEPGPFSLDRKTARSPSFSTASPSRTRIVSA